MFDGEHPIAALGALRPASGNKRVGERNYPAPGHEDGGHGSRGAQARAPRMTLKGLAPLSRAVSIVVRTSASAWAAHMAL